jgi:hypothetical protein
MIAVVAPVPAAEVMVVVTGSATSICLLRSSVVAPADLCCRRLAAGSAELGLVEPCDRQRGERRAVGQEFKRISLERQSTSPRGLEETHVGPDNVYRASGVVVDDAERETRVAAIDGAAVADKARLDGRVADDRRLNLARRLALRHVQAVLVRPGDDHRRVGHPPPEAAVRERGRWGGSSVGLRVSLVWPRDMVGRATGARVEGQTGGPSPRRRRKKEGRTAQSSQSRTRRRCRPRVCSVCLVGAKPRMDDGRSASGGDRPAEGCFGRVASNTSRLADMPGPDRAALCDRALVWRTSRWTYT